MELQAECRVLAVLQCHDLALRAPGIDAQRPVLADVDDQGMISPRLERRGQPSKQARTVMLDPGGTAMHGSAGVDGPPAERLADALMPEADAEKRETARIALDEVERDAGLARRAGTGRQTIAETPFSTSASAAIASLRTTRVTAPSSSK